MEVDGTALGVGRSAFSQKIFKFDLVTMKRTRDIELLATDHHHALASEELFRDDGCQTTQEVAAAVNGDSFLKHIICKLLSRRCDRGYTCDYFVKKNELLLTCGKKRDLRCLRGNESKGVSVMQFTAFSYSMYNICMFHTTRNCRKMYNEISRWECMHELYYRHVALAHDEKSVVDA